jgi:two-component system phosphate regulon sensor histidine kinase PhoR
MKNMNIRLVVLLGAFSIASILIFQIYWVYHTFKITATQFNQRSKIALYAVAEKMADFNGAVLPYNPVNQVTSNYFVVNLASKIDSKVLEHYLRTTLAEHNLNTDCEYAIYNCESNEMAYGNYLSHNPGTEQRKSNTGMFEKQKDLVYYFGVIFPGRTNFIVQSIDIWLVSAVIVFAALSFFAYAIFIILRQKKLSEIQKDFIDNMTHEFKTPISSIAIATHVLAEPGIVEEPERLKRYAGIIRDQNIRLERHIEKVLQVASLERGKEKLVTEKIDLHGIILEVSKSAEAISKSNTPVILHELEAHQPTVYADKFHLTNLIYNLIDNAIKYGGDQPHIIIQTKQSGDKILFSLQDNGPGIDQKYLNRIFDKFFRIPTGNVHTVKGFGIGLYYVKKIVVDHGWKIRVESQPGMGTRIIIEIKILQK